MPPIVLFGGRSDERQVSVASAQNVVRTLGSSLPWFWGTDGAVYDIRHDDLLHHQHPFEIDLVPKRAARWATMERALDDAPGDAMFFLALHGGEGEDGTLQRMLEARGLPFTGSRSEASAIAFDKGRAKELLRGKVRMADERVVMNPADVPRVCEEMLGRYEKIVLKPLAGGSSRGLFFLSRGDEMTTQVTIPYIVEQFISGRELTDGVVDMGEGPVALPVVEIEIDPGRAFDYIGKYLGKGTREICPAKIPDSMRDEAQRTARIAHETLGCQGYSRTDLVAADTGIYFLELNTLPGLTTSSLVPQELKAAGIDFREFLETQMRLARSRAAVRT